MIYLVANFDKNPNKYKYEHLIGNLKEVGIRKYYMIFQYIRKLLFAAAIVLLHDSTYFQIFVISVFNLILFAFLAYKTPFKDRPDNIINAMAEFLLIIC